MSGGIFLIQEDGKLVEMNEQPYDSEALLQELLAKYPNLLAGDQMDGTEPRRWLLVSREMAIPGEEDGQGRWSLDHLFLDQDAIPTLVEVKRSNDTRIRREVVGQMLDYAANAVLYWPVETIRAKFEKTCELRRLDPSNELARLLGEGGEGESFWQNTKTNLQAGRVRLVFVADEIPAELRRVVEFLNGQMDPAEVLAVEVKQYIGDGKMKTLVPRLIGQSSRRLPTATTSRLEKIDEEGFLNAMLEFRGPQECGVAKRIIEWAAAQRLRLRFNKYPKSASFLPIAEGPSGPRAPFYVNTAGNFGLQMVALREIPPFSDESKRQQLLLKLNEIPGVKIPLERMKGYPQIALRDIVDPAAIQALLEALAWLVGELQSTPT